jgi:non-specific serine/threonine protein kinase
MARHEGLSFGDLLRRSRVAAALTQSELAERAGLSARGISDLERGARAAPQRATLQRLIQALQPDERERTELRDAAARAQWHSPGERTPEHATYPLPIPISSLVGREREVSEVQRLLGATRLLTLVGSGGIGKTRLALEVGRDSAEQYRDGVVLVELAPLASPLLVTQAVASALSVREQPQRALLDMLLEVLRPLQLLLVLDNCEHLIDACADLARHLLQGAPELRILVTSREPLDLAGETVWSVPALSLPSTHAESGTGRFGRSEAVRLFVERARAVQPGFALTPGNARAVGEVCRRLDGIPLAIELAAARVSVLSVDQIASRLDDRFRLLVGASRTAPLRQQTLRAALDWSCNLLADPERRVFERLGVFAGGWTLEAAETVCAGDGIDAHQVLDHLARLVEKSLVLVELVDDGEPLGRYRLLETVRQYAVDRLTESGQSDIMRRRHAEHYLGMAAQADSGVRGAAQISWLAALEREHDNLRAALEWCLARPNEVEAGLRLAGALYWFWYLHSYLGEGRRWLDAVLARVEASSVSAPLAKTLAGAGLLACLQGYLGAARSSLGRGLAVAEAVADPRLVALAHHHLAQVALYEGDYTGWRAHLETSLALFRQAGDSWGTALALVSLGHAAVQLGDPAADALLEESLALFRPLGDRWGLARVLHYLGELARSHTDDARAAAFYTECLVLYRELGHHNTAASVLHNLGYVFQHQGNARRAATCFAQGVRLHRQYGDQRNLAMCVAGLAGVAAMRRQFARAARLFGWAESRFEALGAVPDPIDRRELDCNLDRTRAGLGEARFAAAWEAGSSLQLEEAIALASRPDRRRRPVVGTDWRKRHQRSSLAGW